MAVASGGTWTAQYYKSPTGSISINGGANFTASTSVTLSLTYTAYVSSVAQVRYSNDGAGWTAWEAPALSSAWSLASGDGMKTVYYQVKDSGGLVSSTYSDSIMLDTAVPAGSTQINDGATYTNVTTATLTLLATDVSGSGVAEMRFSDNGASFTAWESYSTSKSWTLVGGPGTKYVYVQFKDRVDLTVAAYDAIVLDTMLPVANAGQNQNAQIGQTVTFSGSGSRITLA